MTGNIVLFERWIKQMDWPADISILAESRFLHAVFDNYPLNNIQFRLSPVYTLYMTLRHRLSPYGKPNFPLVQKQENVLTLLYRIEDMISKKIEVSERRPWPIDTLLFQECHEHGGYLAYWIANTSELLYFIKQDRDVSKISHDLQDRLAECVQRLFRYLTHLVQNELDKYLISFTNPQDDVERDVYIAFGKEWLVSSKGGTSPLSLFRRERCDECETVRCTLGNIRKQWE